MRDSTTELPGPGTYLDNSHDSSFTHQSKTNEYLASLRRLRKGRVLIQEKLPQIKKSLPLSRDPSASVLHDFNSTLKKEISRAALEQQPASALLKPMPLETPKKKKFGSN